MANVLVEETSLQDIADAIRSKNGTQNTYKPSQMAEAIEEIIATPNLQAKSISHTPESVPFFQAVVPDEEYDGLSSVSVTVGAIPSSYIIPSGTVNISANGTGIDVAQYASADVAVPSSSPNLQTKSATPTTSAQTVTPDSGYDGLSQVNVGAIPSQYIVPEGTIPITQNGTVDVTEYASANVNVSSSPESGYFVPASTTASFTLSVSRLCSKVIIWADGINATTDLSGKPYPAHSILMFCINNTNGFYYALKIASTQTAVDSAAARIAGWPNNSTSGNGSVVFTSSQIKTGTLTIGGANRPLISGHRYNWEAW